MINIIIPTTFDPTLTYGLLDSIKKHNMGAEYNITVVDNGSKPIFNYFDDDSNGKITTLRTDERLSFAKAMNIGIEYTKDEYVLLLNNDTLITHDGFLSNLLQTINSQEKIGVVSPQTNYISTEPARAQDNEHKSNVVMEWPNHIAAVCFLMKRSTIQDVGLFDENFVNSHDDGDLCQRVLNGGYKIFIDGRSFLFHYGSRSVSQTPGYYEAFQRNSNHYMYKWKL